VSIHGKRFQKAFKPEDLSDDSVEAARLAAVQYRGDLERHCSDTTETTRQSLVEVGFQAHIASKCAKYSSCSPCFAS